MNEKEFRAVSKTIKQESEKARQACIAASGYGSEPIFIVTRTHGSGILLLILVTLLLWVTIGWWAGILGFIFGAWINENFSPISYRVLIYSSKGTFYSKFGNKENSEMRKKKFMWTAIENDIELGQGVDF